MSEIIAISDGLFSLIIVAGEDAEAWTNQRPGLAESSQSEDSTGDQAAWVAAASISQENLKQILARSSSLKCEKSLNIRLFEIVLINVCVRGGL